MADNTIANAIKFLKGEEKSLPAAKTEGQVYFAYKNVGTAEKPSYTGAIYIDTPIGGTQNRIKMTANADIADKAFNDSAGLSIRDTYLSSLGYTDDGKQTILIKGSGNNQTRIALPIASTTKSGIVTTDAQSFGGTKTFTTINSTNLTITGTSGFNYSGIETATGDIARPVWFAYDGINGKPVINTNFTYNPVTQTLSVANLSGTADKANKDNAGNDIRSTYISNITVNGTTLTFTKGSGATSSITLQDNNNAVTQTAIKSSDYTNWRTVLWGASKSGVEGFTPTTVTDCAFTSDTLTFQPSSGTLKAKIFKGNLSGNASTATSANKAINDGTNQNIANTYVKYKSIKFNATADKVYLLEGNGAGSVTATSGSNISTAIIPAATDKAAGVITATTQTFSGDKTFNNSIIVNDCLVSKAITGTDKSRFIILPRVPYSLIDSTHETSTYFKALLKWICANYPNKKDYSFIGLANPNNESNVLIHIYDTGAINAEGYPEYSTGLFKYLGGALCTFGTVSYNYYCRDTLMTNDKYAGSASSGGAAISANRLNTNAGSAIKPVYFSNGIPVQCNDTLANSISGNAATASKLQTARTITLAGSVTGSAVFDGSNNITITTSTNHSHSQYLPLAGGTMNGTSFITWADSRNWDNNNNNVTFPVTRGGLQWYGQSDSVKLFSQETASDNLELVLQFEDDNSNGLSIRDCTGTQTARITAEGKITASSFIGNLNGNANTATALTSSAGSSTQPIYFSGGKPVACTYTLSKSVPADAKFTDTWRGIQNNVTSDSTTDSLSAAQGKYLKGLIDNKLSLSGGRMTGDIGLPSAPSTIDGSVPYAGSTVITDNIATFSSYKTYLGTYMNSEGSWRNIISIRHRNGASDGINYGMMIYTALTGMDSLRWNKQMGEKSWQGERIILDSSNYTSYTVTKTGSGASGTWGINVSGSSTSCSGNAASATTISSMTPTLSTGIENSAITVKTNDNAVFPITNVARLSSIRTAIDFQWYDSNWQIGNIRGDSADSVGFGFAFKPSANDTLALKSYIDTNGVYHGNVTGSAGSVAWGNVSGRPSSMPASDVYSWAKASSKPSYSWDEITNKPSSFNPSSHTHPYLPLSGGTMTGTINFTTNKLACMFGGSTSAYYSGVMHQNFGNEAIVFAATNSVTSFIFKCGQNPTSMANNTWANIIPSMQIKQQSVYINSLINNNVTPGYNLYVNGTTRCNGTLGIGNGSSAEIDFFPNSSSTIGARIKAYSDRIEFVFS